MTRRARYTVIGVADKPKVRFARTLRVEQTSAEDLLWAELRGRRLGVKFRRQHPIDHFILDFYCPARRLAVEVDGSSHEGRESHDRQRDEVLADLGIVVMRVTDEDVRRDLGGVLRRIREAID